MLNRNARQTQTAIILSVPINGTDSEVAGTSSAISSMNMEKARKTESPSVIFSPEVGGSQKVNNVKADSITHGTMMLKM